MIYHSAPPEVIPRSKQEPRLVRVTHSHRDRSRQACAGPAPADRSAAMSRYGVEGRVVLITGGARGIGADAARRLIDAGAHVALVDRDAPALAATASELGAAAFEADVTDRGALEEAVAG